MEKILKEQYFIEINDDTYHLGNDDDMELVKDTVMDYISPLMDDLHKERKKEMKVTLFCKEMTDEQVGEVCEDE